MYRKYFVTILFALLILLFMSFNEARALNPGSDECINCHGSKVAEFKFLPANNVKRFAEFNANGNIVDYAACYVCHSIGHGVAWADADNIIGSGTFSKTANQSVYSSPAVLHFVHDGYNGGKNLAANRSCAAQCHSQVSCQSCHRNIPHSTHGTSQSKFQPGPKLLANGITAANIIENCSTSYCHGSYPTPKRYADPATQNELCRNCHFVPLVPKSQGTAKDSSGHSAELLNISHSTPANQLTVGGVIKTVDCSGCHRTSLTSEHAAVNLNCYTCHKSDKAGVINVINSAGGQQANRNCGKCHFNLSVLPEPAEHNLFHIATQSNNLRVDGGPHGDCNTCHSRSVLLSVSVTVYGTEYLKSISDLARMPAKEYSCLGCHNSRNNLAPKHKAMFEGQETELTELHPGCDTCHKPGTTYYDKVGQIITKLKNGAENYDCSECHDSSSLGAKHTGKIDANCTQTCHKSSLIDEHLSNPVTQKNTLSCRTCHLSTKPDVRLVITAGNTDCAACHQFAHNMNIIQQVPADIPLYPGYQWSLPQQAEIWAGETWMPSGYQGAMMVISNRRNDVSGTEVWAYYRQKMADNGWTLPETEPSAANNFFSAEFSKDKRKVTVFFYGGENHTAGPLVPAGYRVEILYK